MTTNDEKTNLNTKIVLSFGQTGAPLVLEQQPKDEKPNQLVNQMQNTNDPKPIKISILGGFGPPA